LLPQIVTGNRSFLLCGKLLFFCLSYRLSCLNYNNIDFKMLAKSIKKKDNSAKSKILQHNCPEK